MSMFVCVSCQGVGTERLLVKGKKEEVLTVDGDQFRYFLLAGGIEFVFVFIHLSSDSEISSDISSLQVELED